MGSTSFRGRRKSAAAEIPLLKISRKCLSIAATCRGNREKRNACGPKAAVEVPPARASKGLA
jgi:hypothetical protein